MGKVIYFIDDNDKDKSLCDDALYIALTPYAMYCLDTKGIEYSIPTDFVYPEVVESVNFSFSVFNQILSETKQTENYWGGLLKHLEDLGFTDFNYFGKEFSVLRRLVDEKEAQKVL
jgi:hypothetical protein